MPAANRGPGDPGGQDALRRAGDAWALILTSLADGPKHGYALIQDIKEFAGLRLGPGTLYGALDRLERLGLAEALPTDERRHPYQITAAGGVALRAHLDSLERGSAMGPARWAASDARATASPPGAPRATLLPAPVARPAHTGRQPTAPVSRPSRGLLRARRRPADLLRQPLLGPDQGQQHHRPGGAVAVARWPP
jgi:DNA-binding PadR family transcriptional regulator